MDFLELPQRVFEKYNLLLVNPIDPPQPPLKRATVYTQVWIEAKTLENPPKSPLKRGTLNSRIRSEQAF
jgi:hypothetical protein